MIYCVLGEIVLTLHVAVVLLHVAFVLFVVGGGFLVMRWRRLAWVGSAGGRRLKAEPR